ncbi:MAG: hypothetical protein ACYCOS_07305 [Sulfobacillus sp.]
MMMRLKSITATLVSGGLIAVSMALPMGLVSHAAGQPDHGQSQVASAANGQDQGTAQRAEGTVSAIGATSLTLNLQGDGENVQGATVTGQTNSYTLASPLTVMYRGQPLALTSVAVGSQVNVSLNAAGLVSAITVQKLAATVTGTVVTIDKGHRITVLEANGSKVVVQIKEQAAITGVGGVSLTMNDLAVGDAVTISGVSQGQGLMATSVSVTMMVTSSTTTTTTSTKDAHQSQHAKGQDHNQGHQTNTADNNSQSFSLDN